MATAYAAIVSLIHLIEQIPAHHARRPTIFSKKQLREIKSLKEKASYIQNYLEISHSLIDSNEAQDLKRRIVDASYAAADVLELHIVDDIMDQEKEEPEEEEKEKLAKAILYVYEVIQKVMQGVMCFITNKMKETGDLSEVIQKVMQDMDFITNKIEEIVDLQPNNLSHVDHSSRPIPTTIDHDAMVGLDDRLTDQIMDKLTREQSSLQIIPITGMGGIGKTTLARNVYDKSLIVQHFDIRGWVTISQVYNKKQMFLDLLREIGVTINPKEEYYRLGQTLHQHLMGRKYLIIVDDLWNIEAWDALKVFLPDCTNGSRIMVTTRLKDIADKVGSTNPHEINLLDENKSWTLLCQKTFGQKSCPHSELEEVGKKIAKQCKGLPLSIVVIGGILVKSNMMPESWEYVADNINKTISSDDSNCLDILSLSYRHLPINLQPCFLYMGVYPEDQIIRVSELINMWVAEGFLKPNKLKTLEEVAEEYLRDLTQRYLINVNKWGSLGTMKTCSIHDLLRELCLREAHNEKFYLVNKTDKNSSQFTIEHRITIQHGASYDQILQASQSTIMVRSLTCNFPLESISHIPNFKLLRVYNSLPGYYNSNEASLLNLRCNIITRSIHWMSLLWNLQTLVIAYKCITPNYKDGEFQIWKMPHLRHLICARSCSSIYIPDPPDPRHGRIDDSVLENLQTLSSIQSFKCTEEVVRRIPNVKKLVLEYDTQSDEFGPDYYLNNVGLLNKLQSLTLKLEPHCDHTYGSDFIQNCEFPPSLKKLDLNAKGNYFLEDIITRIGWLPHLEKLKLKYVRVKNEWNPIEGQFLRLKVFKLEHWHNLKFWNADSSHFPVLEHLHLIKTSVLEEIPSGIGEIETLQSITLLGCKASVVESANNILEEQQSFGNESFRLAYSHVIIQ